MKITICSRISIVLNEPQYHNLTHLSIHFLLIFEKFPQIGYRLLPPPIRGASVILKVEAIPNISGQPTAVDSTEQLAIKCNRERLLIFRRQSSIIHPQKGRQANTGILYEMSYQKGNESILGERSG